jgi:hypothetical protein
LNWIQKKTIIQVRLNYIHNKGDKIKFNVYTLDSEGNGISSIVGITVTDESVLESVEKRKQAPRLNSMVYLENEVNQLNDSNFYFSENQNSSLATVKFILI